MEFTDLPNQLWVIMSLAVVHVAIVAKEDAKQGHNVTAFDALLNFVIASGSGWLYWQVAVVGDTTVDVQSLAAGVGATMGLRGIDKIREELPKLIMRMLGK